MWRYSEKAKAYFAKPIGLGRPADTNVEGRASDEITEFNLHLVINERGIIREAGFTYTGSHANVATASQLMELMVGRSLEFCANVFTEEMLDRVLGGLPEKQTNAPLLPLEALQDAYQSQNTKEEAPDSPIVCSCLMVTRFELESAIRSKGLRSLQDVQRETFASTGCRSCAPDCIAILEEINGPDAAPSTTDTVEQTKEMLMLELIEAVIDGEIRPALAMDGGDIKINSLQGKRLELQYLGACDGCSSSATTFRYFIEDKLHSLVDPELEIIALSSAESTAH
ncbi:MAG: NifU family protein [Planctomycetes bacterium]|nr:NifU family protein [Planctomycetota bacterium]